MTARHPPRARRRFTAQVAALLATVAGAAAAWDAKPFAALEPGGIARAVEVIDGDTLVLDDGRQVRLVGIQGPKLPLGRPNFPQQPLAPEAKAALEEIALGRELELRFGGLREDRHGRTLAHLVRVEDGLWVQGEMLRRGLGRVYSFPDNRGAVAEMLEIERDARQWGRGVWSDPYFAVRTPAEMNRHVDRFEIVEGKVLDAAKVRGVVYLNFGEDWRRDFTAEIPSAALSAFKAARTDPFALEGRTIRVRGWTVWRNGPAIEVTHPEQIERLD